MSERARRQVELLSTLKARQAWYAAGCPMFDGIENNYASSGDLARDAADDLRHAIEWIEGAATQGNEQMEISIDRRGEGKGALKFSLSVRSLDGHTHSELTNTDRERVAKLLASLLPSVEEAIRPSTANPAAGHGESNGP
ncbi:MAG: hypothetical protein Q8T13_23755 [Acidobacteriota bacterium]|nr:hypothetical protein [Acidobacteriota bacterium]